MGIYANSSSCDAKTLALCPLQRWHQGLYLLVGAIAASLLIGYAPAQMPEISHIYEFANAQLLGLIQLFDTVWSYWTRPEAIPFIQLLQALGAIAGILSATRSMLTSPSVAALEGIGNGTTRVMPNALRRLLTIFIAGILIGSLGPKIGDAIAFLFSLRAACPASSQKAGPRAVENNQFQSGEPSAESYLLQHMAD